MKGGIEVRKAVFIGKAGDFAVFLRAMRRWLRLSLGSTHHWVKEDSSYGAALVENKDLIKEAV